MTAVIYEHVSGFDFQDCHLIGFRLQEDLGISPTTAESWVVRVQPTGTRGFHGPSPWYTGLWRGAKELFVAESLSRVHRQRDLDDSGAWEIHDMPGYVDGVFGLHEGFVVAWGTRADKSPYMVRWDGASFREMPAPPADRTFVVHGVHEDLLLAGGRGGAIAIWNGATWRPLAGARSNVLSVFVVDSNEIYATTTTNQVISGSTHGISVVATGSEATHCIAKWRGEVWVGCDAPLGLCKLEGTTLVSIKPQAPARHFDARRELVFSTNGFVGSTADGSKFMRRPVGEFEVSLADIPPRWA